jgi:hypothetical protein
MKDDIVFIRLFHGRNSPQDQLEEWGFDGPIIGPVGINWTYGTIKVHKPGWGQGWEELPVQDDLVKYQGKFYGDFDVLTEDLPNEWVKCPRHTYEEFEKNIHKVG